MSESWGYSGVQPQLDSGNSKRGWRQLGEIYLFRDIKRLGKKSVVGNLEEERG